MYIRSLPTNEPCPPVVSVCHLSMSYIYVHIPEPVLQHSTQGMLQDLIWHVPAVQRQKSRPTRLTVVECTWMNKLNKLNKMNKRTELSSDGSAHPDGWEAQSKNNTLVPRGDKSEHHANHWTRKCAKMTSKLEMHAWNYLGRQTIRTHAEQNRSFAILELRYSRDFCSNAANKGHIAAQDRT
jgi:hypothetical protein